MTAKKRRNGQSASRYARQTTTPPQRREPDPPTHEDDPFVTLAEVGRQIGMSQQTVKRWVLSKLIEAHARPSGLWSVRQSEINKFLRGTNLNKQVTAPTSCSIHAAPDGSVD